jgi:hypothetical protein
MVERLVELVLDFLARFLGRFVRPDFTGPLDGDPLRRR